MSIISGRGESLRERRYKLAPLGISEIGAARS